MEKIESPAASHAVSLILVGIGVSFLAVIIMLALQANMSSHGGIPGVGSPFTSSNELKKFSSYNEISNFLSDVQAYFGRLYSYHADREGMPTLGPAGGVYGGGAENAPSLGSGTAQQPLTTQNAESRLPGSPDFSEYSGTNVQVAGVDEADFIKNDGKYAYVLSGDKLTIIDAYPPEDAKVESRVSLDIAQGQSLHNMFLNGDRLVVFYQEYGRQNIGPLTDDNTEYAAPSTYEPRTHMLIIDISDRASPKVLKNYDVTGQYSSSRMIGDQIFMLSVSSVDYQQPVKPSVIDSSSSSSKLVAEPDVYYFDYPQQNYAFNTVTMLDLDQVRTVADDNNGAVLESPLVSKTFMIGAGTTVYVSDENIYLAYPEISPVLPVMRQNGIAQYISPEAPAVQKTVIHKISIGSSSLFDYVGKGEVPGRLLNQFSMDEQGDRFAVATTSEYSSSRGFFMENNVYSLDARMAVIGKLEGIAEGESIYAARFVGDRLYLVTFRQTDPFFVIDLSNDQPKVLGELKLPGFSNYLHPYDGSHVIGIGREGSEAGSQGVKVALFDVSEVSHPKAVDTYVVGGSQTDSEVLRDHKALLFDREKDVLSIPISSYDGYYSDNAGNQDPLYRESAPWIGFYVFGINPQAGIELKGTIQHNQGGDGAIDMSQGSRSFFIQETLYTVTPALIKMNNLNDVEIEMNSIPLSGTGEIIRPLVV
ncbi:MAG: beta-propeller domain-containing protein [Nitrososphaera sp.]